MGIGGMVEGRRDRVRMETGCVLCGRCVRKRRVADPETGKKRWAVTLREVTSPADPDVTAGQATLHDGEAMRFDAAADQPAAFRHLWRPNDDSGA